MPKSKPDGDALLEGLVQGMHDSSVAKPDIVALPVPAAKAYYSHEAMVELMIAHPTYSHGQLAGHFGRPAQWMASVLASDAFQQVLDGRRSEVNDPSLTATIEERFRALALRSVHILQDQLSNPKVNEFVVLKAAELGVKALGIGQRQPDVPPAPKLENSSQTVADKLLAAMTKMDERRTVDAEIVEVRDV